MAMARTKSRALTKELVEALTVAKAIAVTVA